MSLCKSQLPGLVSSALGGSFFIASIPGSSFSYQCSSQLSVRSNRCKKNGNWRVSCGIRPNEPASCPPSGRMSTMLKLWRQCQLHINDSIKYMYSPNHAGYDSLLLWLDVLKEKSKVLLKGIVFILSAHVAYPQSRTVFFQFL